jgi:AraC-like DNA-binding protein
MEDHSNIPEKLIPILDYINENLEGDLSLEFLEKRFYINGSYLSRLFKKSTGSTIHEYIIYKRISKAKKLLAEGSSATEAAFMCGFNDFSNFSRLFKRTVGVSLRQYKTDAKKGK